MGQSISASYIPIISDCAHEQTYCVYNKIGGIMKKITALILIVFLAISCIPACAVGIYSDEEHNEAVEHAIYEIKWRCVARERIETRADFMYAVLNIISGYRADLLVKNTYCGIPLTIYDDIFEHRIMEFSKMCGLDIVRGENGYSYPNRKITMDEAIVFAARCLFDDTENLDMHGTIIKAQELGLLTAEEYEKIKDKPTYGNLCFVLNALINQKIYKAVCVEKSTGEFVYTAGILKNSSKDYRHVLFGFDFKPEGKTFVCRKDEPKSDYASYASAIENMCIMREKLETRADFMYVVLNIISAYRTGMWLKWSNLYPYTFIETDKEPYVRDNQIMETFAALSLDIVRAENGHSYPDREITIDEAIVFAARCLFDDTEKLNTQDMIVKAQEYGLLTAEEYEKIKDKPTYENLCFILYRLTRQKAYKYLYVDSSEDNYKFFMGAVKSPAITYSDMMDGCDFEMDNHSFGD